MFPEIMSLICLLLPLLFCLCAACSAAARLRRVFHAFSTRLLNVMTRVLFALALCQRAFTFASSDSVTAAKAASLSLR
jgi:hypothetical protein